MEIMKIIMLGILGAMIVGLLRSAKPEFAIFATIATGVIIIIILLNSLTSAIDAFTFIVTRSGVDEELFKGILKIIGIGYLTEFSASICEDADCKFIATKISLAGKITIFLMSIPIVTALIEVIEMIVGLEVG